MKTVLLKTITFVILVSALLIACTKDPIIKNNPAPGPLPTELGLIRFIADTNLTGHYHSSNLTAVVSIENERNEDVVKEKLLTVDLTGTTKTENLKLPAGKYKLTSFRLVYGSVNTHFAIPKANSLKSSLVNKPLPLEFTVVSAEAVETPVEIIKVNKGDKPQQFGYPAGAFDNNQSEESAYMHIKIKPVVQIGDVVYDSIPAALAISTYSNTGEMNTTYTALKAGVNEVQLLKSGAQFKFTLSKWGINADITLTKESIDDETVYIIGGSKEAKKLKSELVYQKVNDTYVPQSKKEYIYNASGKITSIKYYLRNADKIPYVAMTEKFDYSGSLLQKINRFDEKGNNTGYTSFTYNQQGKVVSMIEKANGYETTANVDYPSGENHHVKIQYHNSLGNLNMRYYLTYKNGNMVEGIQGDPYTIEPAGLYDYDFNINPYKHFNYPNLYFANSSKNNPTNQYKPSHYGSAPLNATTFSYTYDSDGYPKESIKYSRIISTGQVYSTTKTVFIY